MKILDKVPEYFQSLEEEGGIVCAFTSELLLYLVCAVPVALLVGIPTLIYFAFTISCMIGILSIVIVIAVFFLISSYKINRIRKMKKSEIIDLELQAAEKEVDDLLKGNRT